MQVQQGRTFIGRFKKGLDLLTCLTQFCKKENIRLGTFSVMGALSDLTIGYYLQDEQRYSDGIRLQQDLEIVSCYGNISLKDHEIFVHAHIIASGHDGRCHGGHVLPGSHIFAAEYSIQELTGAELTRKFDPETGLSLW